MPWISADSGMLRMFGNQRFRPDSTVPSTPPPQDVQDIPQEEQTNETLNLTSTKKLKNRMVTGGYEPVAPNNAQLQIFGKFKPRNMKSKSKTIGFSSNTSSNPAITEAAKTTVSTILNMFARGKFEFASKAIGRGPQIKVDGKTEGPQARQEVEGEVAEGGTGEEGGDNKGEGEGGGDGGTTMGEITISIPKFHQNEQGIWVYNKWQATYGKLWQDTRFNEGNEYTIPRIALNSNPATNYLPT